MSRMRTSKKCSKHLERVTHLKKTTNRHEIRKYGKARIQVRAFFWPSRCFTFQVLMLPRNGYIVWGCHPLFCNCSPTAGTAPYGMATSYGAVPAVGEQLQKSGWLEQIDHGVYKRHNDSIQWQGALYAVQTLQGLPVCKSKTLVSLYG